MIWPNKLERHKMTASAVQWSRLAALKAPRKPLSRPVQVRPADEADGLAQLLGAEVARNRYGEHLTIRRWFSTPECCEPTPQALELLLPADAPAREERRIRSRALTDPSQWLFLDTETTGLAGGTGTYAFLIGVAWWGSGGLQVEQFFMRDYTEEHSLLEELSARVAERPLLVTFNGKSFDWPLLETRFTLTRAIKPPRLAAHVDLLHPARAFWKLRLGSVRLIELERAVLDAPHLGWDRDDDIDAALIPQVYFDFLRGGPAEPLSSVARHNQMDLRGLAALLGKITAFLADSEPRADSPEEALDLFGLSRFLRRRGNSQRARTAGERALNAGLSGEFRALAGRELALLAKRDGDFGRAIALWEELTTDLRVGIHACEQLAIHYEHRARDFACALEYAQLALAKLRRLRRSAGASQSPEHAERLQSQLTRRLMRLERKSSGKR